MRRIIVLLLLLSVAMAVKVNVTAPVGEYGHGMIPIEVQLLDNDGDKIDEDVTIRAHLYADNIKLQEVTLEENDGDYVGEFEILVKGDYHTKFYAYWNDSDYYKSKTFEVTTSAMYIDIQSPENNTMYDGEVEIKVELTMDDSFVHNADVTAQIGSKKITLPEGQNYYRSALTLTAGYYTMNVTAEKDNQQVSKLREFSVGGEIITEDNDTEYIPGPRLMTLTEISPDKGQYALGEELEIGVMALDNQNVKMTDATVVAEIKTPAQTYEIEMVLRQDPVNPKYVTTIMLTESGFYEVYVNAEKEGYTNATAYFGPFRAGVSLPEMPEGVECADTFCIKVTSPDTFETYSSNKSVEFRVQAIERTAISPLNDVTISAKVGDSIITLDYDWNGYYASESLLAEGQHVAEFTANWRGKPLKTNVSFLVSPHSLHLSPVNPAIGSNVTTSFVDFKIKIADETGEIVTDVNARAVIDTPGTGRHTVTLDRDVETGLYMSKFTFSSSGTHTVKLVGSKVGYVSGENVYTFEVLIPEEEQPIASQDIIIIALIAGVIIIIATLWRALI